jgi:uncharacterized phage infection (PIP) family protein YhgE
MCYGDKVGETNIAVQVVKLQAAQKEVNGITDSRKTTQDIAKTLQNIQDIAKTLQNIQDIAKPCKNIAKTLQNPCKNLAKPLKTLLNCRPTANSGLLLNYSIA